MTHTQDFPRGTRVTVNGYPRPAERNEYRYRYLYTRVAQDGRRFPVVAMHDYLNHEHYTVMFQPEHIISPTPRSASHDPRTH